MLNFQAPSQSSIPHYTTTIRCMSSDSTSSSDNSSPAEPEQRAKKSKNKKKKKRRFASHDTKDDHLTTTATTKLVSTRERDNENAHMEEVTRAWVKRVVVGLNLCPFAAKPLNDEQLYISVVRGDNLEELLRQILAQSLILVGDDNDEDAEEPLPGTALLVCPDLVPHDFDEYLNVLTMVVDGLLEDYGLVGKVQVVPFHPQFVFADGDGFADGGDSSSSKMEYWTNRSPYPMFHILKEDDVSHAIELVKGDTDKIWQRNVHLLQRMEELAAANDSNNDNDEKPSSDNNNNNNSSLRTALESYLRSGTDDKEGTATALVQQALDETSVEFPMLKRPISSDSSDVGDDDGEGDDEDEDVDKYTNKQ